MEKIEKEQRVRDSLMPVGSSADVVTLDYYVLDVFTEQRLMGNSLAVVLNPGGLSDDLLQAIAREMNLSETTFVERGDAAAERVDGVRVRIFTTQEELPFAGHPTLGTASLLRSIAPECMTGDFVRLALPAGCVPVEFESRGSREAQWPVRGEMRQNDPDFGEVLDPGTVASLTGLVVEDFDPACPIRIVSTGAGFAIVVLRDIEALSRLCVRQKESGAYLRARGARWFYVLGPEGCGADLPGIAGSKQGGKAIVWRARMQFNGGEDPATGSAAGCAISHLVNCGIIGSEQSVCIRQGIEIGRPSEITVSARKVAGVGREVDAVTDVRVGGSTILAASGRLFLP